MNYIILEKFNDLFNLVIDTETTKTKIFESLAGAERELAELQGGHIIPLTEDPILEIISDCHNTISMLKFEVYFGGEEGVDQSLETLTGKLIHPGTEFNYVVIDNQLNLVDSNIDLTTAYNIGKDLQAGYRIVPIIDLIKLFEDVSEEISSLSFEGCIEEEYTEGISEIIDDILDEEEE